MKYKIVLLLLTTLFICSCKKDEFELKNATSITSGVSTTLKSILFINSDTGYIVGGSFFDESTIIQTQDGGETWLPMQIQNNPKKIIESVIATPQKLYAVGLDGKVYFNEKNNILWDFHQNIYWEWMRDLAITAPNNLLIIAGRGWELGTIYMLDSNFVQINKTEYPFELCDILEVNQTNYLISGYGSILISEDIGTNWKYTNAKGDYFKKMCKIGRNDVWVCGYNGTIIHSKDGGKNWYKSRNGNNPTLKKHHFNSICFTDENTGFVVGDNGTILFTKDKGKNWNSTKKITDNDLYDIKAINEQELLVIGDKGTIFKLTISNF